MSDLRKLLDEATPGPWEAALEPKCHGVVASINGQARFVALIGNDTDTPEREPMRFANAHLIALAPDLAAALLKAEEALMRTQRFIPSRVIRCNGYKCRKPWCASCFDEDEAEEALEKAEADGDIARATLTEIRKLTGAA